jgi:hypothetical protein
MPLSFLAEFQILDIQADITYRQLGTDCAKDCVKLFDDIQVGIQQLIYKKVISKSKYKLSCI